MFKKIHVEFDKGATILLGIHECEKLANEHNCPVTFDFKDNLIQINPGDKGYDAYKKCYTIEKGGCVGHGSALG